MHPFARLVLALLVACSVVVGIARPAGAEPDSVPCAADGTQVYAPGPPVTLMPNALSFTMAIDLLCIGFGDDRGNWTFTAVGFASPESCAEAVGSAFITGGTSEFDGSVTGGGITLVRTDHLLHLVGQISTSADSAPHVFTAELAWLPMSDCIGTPTFFASLTGAATMTDGASVTTDAGAAACAIGGNVSAVPGVMVLPSGQLFALTSTWSCVGVGDPAGTWALAAAASGPLESCAEGAGTGSFVSGSSPSEGAVVGGGFAYARVGNVIEVAGTIATTIDVHPFTATLAISVTSPNCITSPITTASFSGAGTISDV